MRNVAITVALAGLAVAGAGAPLAAAKPAAAKHAAERDWAKVTAVTPEGTFVIGNPRAKVKLVEYLSMTCPHCAHFNGEAMAPLTDNYIRKGLVSLEVRHAIRDGLDMAAALLVRCNGPATFLAGEQAVLAGQDKWMLDAAAFEQADKGAAAKLPPGEAFFAMAHGAGLDRIMAAHGVSEARAKACLANKKELDRLTAMATEGWTTRRIPGTPAFLIDGTLVEGISGWPSLEPKLQEALR